MDISEFYFLFFGLKLLSFFFFFMHTRTVTYNIVNIQNDEIGRSTGQE